MCFAQSPPRPPPPTPVPPPPAPSAVRVEEAPGVAKKRNRGTSQLESLRIPLNPTNFQGGPRLGL